MKGLTGTFAAFAAVALFAFAALAGAETPAEAPTAQDRPTYVAAVEKICAKDTDTSQRILKGVRAKVRNKQYRSAGRQFIRASDALGKSIGRLSAVPRPPADDARLVKWFSFLKKVQVNLRRMGQAYVDEDQVKANHRMIHAERSANAANNVGSIYFFRECRLDRSRFSG